MDYTHNTANFLASSFLNSKRSLKKIYNLNPAAIGILRYICDSIDLNYAKRKKFETKLYQRQIARFCHCTPKTLRVHLKHLIKKRLLKFNGDTYKFTLGQTLLGWVNITEGKEVGKIYLPLRSGSNLPLSNSSNLSNKAKSQFWGPGHPTYDELHKIPN